MRMFVLLRSYKVRVAVCALLALMSVFWSHSLYAAGWSGGPGGGGAEKRGVMRSFRIR